MGCLPVVPAEDGKFLLALVRCTSHFLPEWASWPPDTTLTATLTMGVA